MHFSLCDSAFDIVQNSAEAEAEHISIFVNERGHFFDCEIIDDGCGMTEAQLAAAKNPFYTDGKKHPGRKTGLGLPFLLQAAEQTKGECTIESKAGSGTKVFMRFDLRNIDTPPVGNVSNFFLCALLLAGGFEMRIERIKENGRYVLLRSELKNALGEFESSKSKILLKKFIEDAERECSRP